MREVGKLTGSAKAAAVQLLQQSSARRGRPRRPRRPDDQTSRTRTTIKIQDVFSPYLETSVHAQASHGIKCQVKCQRSTLGNWELGNQSAEGLATVVKKPIDRRLRQLQETP
jgi:hypothetical protein